MSNKNHKTIVAAFLLALYAFMVTPVSYWHQHSIDSRAYAGEKQSNQVKNVSAAVDENCKICAHHYSVAANDAIIISFSPWMAFISYDDCYFQQRITNPGYNQSNKGPPALV